MAYHLNDNDRDAHKDGSFTDERGRLWEDASRGRLMLPAVEINAVSNCNLACVGCSRRSPEAAPEFAVPEEVFRDLKAFSSAALCKTVRVTGGEPLLHPDLPGLLRAIKRSGAARFTELITNGALLRRGGWEWARSVDRVQISLYPGREPSKSVIARFVKFCSGVGADVSVRRYTTFRHCYPEVQLTAAKAALVFKACQDAHASSCHVLSRGVLYLCLPSLALGASGADVLPLKPARGLSRRLAAFLYRQTALRACRRCLGTSGNEFAHAQAPRGDWKKLSEAGTVDGARLKQALADPWSSGDDYEELRPWARHLPGESRFDADWRRFFGVTSGKKSAVLKVNE